jgi:hypothetical protein
VTVLYVDSKEHKADRFERYLLASFETRVIGPLTWFLNIHVIHHQKEGRLYLSQATYIEKLEAKFQIKGKKPRTPLPTDLHGLYSVPESVSTASIIRYQ